MALWRLEASVPECSSTLPLPLLSGLYRLARSLPQLDSSPVLRSPAVTISLGIANTIFLNLAQNSISRILPNVSRSTVQGAITGVDSKFLTTLSPVLQKFVLEAIIHAIQKIFILGITAGCLSVILAVVMSRKKINLRQAVVDETPALGSEAEAEFPILETGEKPLAV